MSSNPLDEGVSGSLSSAHSLVGVQSDQSDCGLSLIETVAQLRIFRFPGLIAVSSRRVNLHLFADFAVDEE